MHLQWIYNTAFRSFQTLTYLNTATVLHKLQLSASPAEV